jgi:hypothetical protein
MKQDFEKIIESNVIFNYTSDFSQLSEGNGVKEIGKLLGGVSTLTDKYGSVVAVTGGKIEIIITPGRDDVVIHENRHAGQLLNLDFDKSIESVRRREYDAWGIQNTYDPERMRQTLTKVMGEINRNERANGSLKKLDFSPTIKEAVDYMYRPEKSK